MNFMNPKIKYGTKIDTPLGVYSNYRLESKGDHIRFHKFDLASFQGVTDARQ